MVMIWQTATKLTATDPAARREELLEHLFLSRQLTSHKEREQFLNPPALTLDLIQEIPDLDQGQLKAAAARITQAITSGQPILIYGDYDCDGVCATALLWETLHALGAAARPFIPRRGDHGYGLSPLGLKEALAKFEQKPLIITVDNGITAAPVVSEFGDYEFIITDHHTKPATLPKAAAIVHTTQVCGTGVAWILASTLLNRPAPSELVALATVCDLLPLLGLNRRFLVAGLKQLRTTGRPGLLALYQLAGIKNPEQIDTYHLGYLIGPRINAVGRLGHGLDALRLLCTRKPEAAIALANKLSEVNQERQDKTVDHTAIAKALFADKKKLPKILIAASDSFHEGIIGLVAAKLVELYHRPAVVISTNHLVAKGSARSIPGVDITALLRIAADETVELGGHNQAAGFKLPPESLPSFQQKLEQAAETITEDLLVKKILISAALEPTDLNLDLYQALEQFAPWGYGNEKPVFSGVLAINQVRLVGRDGSHLQLKLSVAKQLFSAIGFGWGSKLPALAKHTTPQWAFVLDKNDWQGRSKLQLIVKDWQAESGVQ